MDLIKVVAKKGTKCPMQNRPKRYITDTKPVDVPDNSYYKRLIRDGSLVVKNEESRTTKQKTKREGGSN
jgi:hypothetical protein